MTENLGIYNPGPFEALNITLPEDLRTQTHQETHKLLVTMWLESFVSCSSADFKNIFIDTFSDFGTQDFSLITQLDRDYIDEILGQAILRLQQRNPEEYERLRGDISQSYIICNGVSINFHQYFEYYAPKTSLRPRSRPENLQSTIIPEGPNHFEKLQENGFSGTMRNFIQRDFFPKIMGKDIHCEEIHIERIQKFMEFLIDMETSGGTQLINGISTATGYTQTLNEKEANREEGKFNSIDTRLRIASQFYDAGEIIYNTELPIDPGIHPRAQWVKDLWEYNTEARSMIDFTFDSEVRLTLIYLLQKNPDAMKDIIMGKNEAQAAQILYEAHHTNVDGQHNTSIVMFQKLLQHYS